MFVFKELKIPVVFLWQVEKFYLLIRLLLTNSWVSVSGICIFCIVLYSRYFPIGYPVAQGTQFVPLYREAHFLQGGVGTGQQERGLGSRAGPRIHVSSLSVKSSSPVPGIIVQDRRQTKTENSLKAPYLFLDVTG